MPSNNSKSNLQSTLFVGGLLFVLGIAIILTQFVKSDRLKNVIIMALTLATIPAIVLQFIDYTGVTVWTISIVLMMTTLVFDTKAPLFCFAAMALLTQAVLWIYSPKKPLMFDEFDHILRMGLILIALWTGTIVNNVYRKRLRENLYQIEFQKIVSEVSTNFVSVNQSNLDEQIGHMLERMGKFFFVDRTYVMLIHPEGKAVDYTYEWYAEEVKPGINSISSSPLEEFTWIMDRLSEDKLLCLEDTENLPDDVMRIKTFIRRHDIKSLVMIPIEGSKDLLGFIGLDSMRDYKKWSDYHIGLLRIFANILADGLMKIKAEKEIEYMAYFDHLTGIPNRTLFSDRLTQAIHLAQGTSSIFGVIFLDLDSFKTINDTMGHSGGDEIIREVARSLSKNLGKADTVSRFGGDEFLILLDSTEDMGEIISMADDIMSLFEKPFSIYGQNFYTTCSAGIAVYPFDGEDAGSLMKNADIAMYIAKSQGKNQYVLCTEDMKEEVQRNMTLANHLYHALERGELALYYQPQISLVTGEIIGLEGLLRWFHPELGFIAPSVFIPLAEKIGFINTIGNWVIRSACEQHERLKVLGLPPLRMAVNLSAIQFNNPHIVENIEDILEDTNMDPHHLELEITESIAIKETFDTVETLNRFKDLGLTISIDDFGTEYSSLGRLKQLPIDRIKIDMQFIQAIENSEKDKAITQVIINLAKSLSLEVLAGCAMKFRDTISINQCPPMKWKDSSSKNL